MINEDRLNTYGEDFDSDTHTVYVKMNGEVKDYKLTEKQYNDLCMYVFNTLLERSHSLLQVGDELCGTKSEA